MFSLSLFHLTSFFTRIKDFIDYTPYIITTYARLVAVSRLSIFLTNNETFLRKLYSFIHRTRMRLVSRYPFCSTNVEDATLFEEGWTKYSYKRPLFFNCINFTMKLVRGSFDRGCFPNKMKLPIMLLILRWYTYLNREIIDFYLILYLNY